MHAPDDSPFKRAMSECGHSPAEHLQLLLQFTLAVANWQRGSGKDRDRPRPVECLLPEDQRPEKKHLGDARMSLDETADWLGWSLPEAS